MSPHKHRMKQALKRLNDDQRAALIELGINQKTPQQAGDDLSMRPSEAVVTFKSALHTLHMGYDAAKGDR